MATSDKTVIILGGGMGGIVVANRLRKKLSRKHKIILIDKERDYIFTPSFLWMIIGLRTPEQISHPLSDLRRKGIDIINGEIQEINPEVLTVKVNGKEIKGDYLVIALGAELFPQKIPDLSEAGYNFYTLQGAMAFRSERLKVHEGRIVVLVSGVPFKCPAAPYEAAMLIEYDCRKRKIRHNIQIDLYSPEPGPMGVAGPEVSARVREMVESKDIRYHPEHQVLDVDPAAKKIRFTNGVTTDFDLLAYVPPHQTPGVVHNAGLANERGWIPVNRDTLETQFPGVYAIGDITEIILPMGKPLPKAGVFAHGEGEIVANNIACHLTGKGKSGVFNGHGECFIETGDGKAAFGSGNFFAEPLPVIKMRGPNRALHLGKIAFEKFWLFEWF